MNWCVGCKFKTSLDTYTITGVWWQGGVPVEYEFVNSKGELKSKTAKQFHEQIKDSNFTGITK